LVAQLNERYGIGMQEAQEAVAEWLSSLEPKRAPEHVQHHLRTNTSVIGCRPGRTTLAVRVPSGPSE